MIFGSPLAAGLGEPQNMVSYVNLIPVVNGVLLRFMARAGYGNAYFGVYNNSILVANVYAPEVQEPTPLRVTGNYFSNRISLCLLRLGHLGDQGYNIARVARTYESADSKRVTVAWTWKPKIICAQSDGGYTSNWSLAGLTRRNTNGVSGKQTWGQLAFDLSVAGGNVTVTLRQGQSTLASGTAAVGNTVTLAQANGSGVSGTVTVSGGVLSTSNAILYIRWPASLNIRRDTVNPPLVTVANVPFDGLDDATWTEPSDLGAGTYYYNLAEVSDTGEEGTQSAPAFTEVINGAPGSPTNLAYVSGTAATGITLSFTPSPTAGATYRLYLGMPGAQMDLNIVSATASAGATQITTPAISGVPGIARVLLRAVLAGVEEKNILGFDINLDGSNNYISRAPNTPTLLASSLIVSAGLTLSLRGTYSTLNEAGVATQLQLFTRALSGSYGAAVATSNLASSSCNMKSAPFTYTFGASGLYYVALKALTAGGVVSAISDELLVYVSTELMAPPDNAAAYVSRG